MGGLPIDTTVLRLGYRVGRDPRITTHLGLVARALGADSFLIAGDQDTSLFETLDQVQDSFGGDMDVGYVDSADNWIREFISLDEDGNSVGTVVHLTMYGSDYRQIVKEIPRDKPLAILVGGSKVPPQIYRMAQYNVSVGNQPHSEVAALALFMDKLQQGSWVDSEFEGARLRIIPDAHNKTVIEQSDGLQKDTDLSLS